MHNSDLVFRIWLAADDKFSWNADHANQLNELVVNRKPPSYIRNKKAFGIFCVFYEYVRLVQHVVYPEHRLFGSLLAWRFVLDVDVGKLLSIQK
jgi:hypothetical protein